MSNEHISLKENKLISGVVQLPEKKKNYRSKRYQCKRDNKITSIY